MLLDVAANAGTYPRAMRLEAARLISQRSPVARFRIGQTSNVNMAKAANAPTANHETLAASANASFSSQFERKIAIRMENDPDFRAIMNEANG